MAVREREKQAFIKALGKPVATSFLKIIGKLNQADQIVFTIGDEAANVCQVTVQVKGDGGANATSKVALRFYLSSDAAGLVPADISTVAAGASGTVISPTVNGGTLITTATGISILALTVSAGAATRYLNVVLPTGEIVTSPPITWAA